MWFYLLFIILEVTKYGDGELPSGFQQWGLREDCNYKREKHGIFFFCGDGIVWSLIGVVVTQIYRCDKTSESFLPKS